MSNGNPDAGPITFTPPAAVRNATTTVQATAGHAPVTWSIEGPDLGCTIEEASGRITIGDQSGVIRVRAMSADAPHATSVCDLWILRVAVTRPPRAPGLPFSVPLNGL